MINQHSDTYFPRYIAYLKPIRLHRQVIWLGGLIYLMGLFILMDEILPSFGQAPETWIILCIGGLVAVIAMAWVQYVALQRHLHLPRREYRARLEELDRETLKHMAEHHAELSPIERGVLRGVLNSEHPGWSTHVSSDAKRALSD